MNDSPKTPFVPISLRWLGASFWLLLTAVSFADEAARENYGLVVLAFGLFITALTMAMVAGWTTLLVTLVLNWLSASRRVVHRPVLFVWSGCFATITVIAVWSIFSVHS